MKITIEPTGYRLTVSLTDYQELEGADLRLPAKDYWPLHTFNGEVLIKVSKETLAQINMILMDRIANEAYYNEYRCLLLHHMIDDLVVADGLHTGYPNTWPWIEDEGQFA